MYLSAENAELFYKLWLGLLSYVNKKHNVVPELGEMKSPAGLDIQKVGKIRNKLWEDKISIDEYVEKNAGTLTEREVNILAGWKNNVGGEFVVVKNLKNFSVFMTTEKKPKLYGVTGIYNSVSDMFPTYALPLYVKAQLIPFEGRIIYDSVIFPYNVMIGRNMASDIRDSYNKVKASGNIITTLGDDIASTEVNETDIVNLSEKKLKKKPPTKKPKAKKVIEINDEREKRIESEIIADAYGSEERSAAWYNYLYGKIYFPFDAEVIKKHELSPLRKNDYVSVLKLSGEEYCRSSIYVQIQWEDRKFSVPLEQLSPFDSDEETAEAIEDWRYWVDRNYMF